MKVKNMLFETLARSESLKRLGSASGMDEEMKHKVFELKVKIADAERPFLEYKKDIFRRYSVKGVIPPEKIPEADVELNKVGNIEVEFEHEVLVFDKIPKEINSNDMFYLRELVRFDKEKKAKSKNAKHN